MSLNYTTAAQRIARDGGATLRIDGRAAPRTGYAVAPRKDSERTCAVAELVDTLSAFCTDHAAELAAPRTYVGAWIEDGTCYVDVSIIVRSLRAAMTIARGAKQLAIYDIANDATIYTVGTVV